jgi:hypothetical protein
MMGRQTEATDQTAADYVEHALDDLNQACQGAQAETRARQREQRWEWQRELEEASDQVRLELGIEVVRAQRTSQALDAMAHEIKCRKKELPWGA